MIPISVRVNNTSVYRVFTLTKKFTNYAGFFLVTGKFHKIGTLLKYIILGNTTDLLLSAIWGNSDYPFFFF